MWLNSLRSTNEVSWAHAEQLITNQLLCQLSHIGIYDAVINQFKWDL